jgi:hypothetical protein
MTTRDQLKAEFREMVRKSRRAIDEGFEPGIERMLDAMADAAERHAAEVGVIAVKREDDLPPDRGIPDMPALRGERNDPPVPAAPAEQPKPAPRRPAARRTPK